MQKQFLQYLNIIFFTFCLNINIVDVGAYVLPKSFDDLVREADIILEGTVGEKRSEWAEDRSVIYTFITLFDIEVIDGAYEGTTFILRMDGGEVEEAGRVKGLEIPGTPEFEIGDRVVLFVKNNAWEVCPLVGWDQGAFRVTEDPVSKKTRLSRLQDGDGISGIDTSTGNLLMEPPVLPQDRIIPEPVDDDPIANEMRRQHEQERQKVKDQNKSASGEFTLLDFKRSIKDKANMLKAEGKKHARAVQSADIRIHRKGRPMKSARPPQDKGVNQ